MKHLSFSATFCYWKIVMYYGTYQDIVDESQEMESF